MKTILTLLTGFVSGALAVYFLQVATRPKITPVPEDILTQLGGGDEALFIDSPLYISWDEDSGSIVGLRRSGPPLVGVRMKHYFRFSPQTGSLLPTRFNEQKSSASGKTLDELTTIYGAAPIVVNPDPETLPPRQ